MTSHPSTRRAVAAIAAIGIGAAALLGCASTNETSESGRSAYPPGDVRLIIQANPGGGSDLSSRALASELEQILGVSVIAENMPGAAGARAMEYVASQPADGKVIGFGPVEIAMLNTTQGADVLPERYDFLGQIMLAPGVVSVAADSEIKSLKDLVARSQGTPLTVGNAGAGSIWEAATRGLSKATGAKLEPLPYDGGATAVSAAASGEADAAVSGLGEALAQDDAVRILAVLHNERLPQAPDVPTAEEAIGESVQFGGWGGIYAPAGLPQDVKTKLEDAIARAVKSKRYQEFQDNSGNLVVYRDAAAFTSFVEEQFGIFEQLLGAAPGSRG